MKSIKMYALLALLLMAGGALQAQEWMSMLNDNSEWNILWQSTPSITLIEITESMKLEGDTLIDDVQYKKLWRKLSSQTGYWLGCLEYCLYGFMREEPEGKVFYQPIDQDTTYLLYDFGMNVNDTTLMRYMQSPSPFDNVTIRIDSITTQYIAGAERRVYYVSSKSSNGFPADWRWLNTWIEGIGATEGLLYSCHCTTCGGIIIHELLCYHEDGELVWQNPSYNTCLIDNYDGIQDNTEEAGVHVYPNPAKDIVVIDGIEPAEVQVYNALGQLVKTVRGTNEVDLSGLVEGVYLLRLTDKEGNAYLEKIIKE